MLITFALMSLVAGPLGYLGIAGLVAIESVGVPVPGETALITGGVLAHSGQLHVGVVIASAAAGAIVGDNIGYVLGRVGGRQLLERPGPLEARRRQILIKGEPFFARHGAQAVFFGRWISGLRIAAAWLAGINRMRWPAFLFWNALGGIAWATSVGLLAYFLGPAVGHVIKAVGLVGTAAVVVVILGLLLARRRRSRRRSVADDT
jgi:membrane protein DedA with SNARE-associated domain